MALLKYPSYDSTVLNQYYLYQTSFSTFGSGLILVVYLFRIRDLELIDLEIILFMYPTIIVGTEIGNYFNRYLPDEISTILILVIMFVMLVLMFKKFIEVVKDDQDVLQTTTQIVRSQIIVEEIFQKNESFKGQSISVHRQRKSPMRQRQLITQIIIIFVLYQATIFLRGGKKLEIMKVNGSAYYIFTIIIFTTCIALYIFILKLLIKQERQRRLLEDPDFFQTRSYNAANIFKFSMVGLFGCFFTGLIGMGVSILIVPLFNYFNQIIKLSAKQIAATLTVCLFLISISTTIQCYLNPTTQYEDCFLYMGLGALSTIITILIYQIKIKFQNYWDSLIIVIIIGLFLLTLITGSIQLYQNWDDLVIVAVPEKCDDFS
ncbi:hypothetical protein pb186bvf_018090 [Paramecium bursaria]